MTRLSRRDRAAMVMSLAVLRSVPRTARGEVMLEGAAVVLREAHGALTFGHSALLPRSVWLVTREGAPPRLLRARLALALRAMLRADAGDCGPVRCPSCGARGHVALGQCFAGAHAIVRVGKRIAPLWQQAPRTGEGRRPAGLRRRGA